MPPSSRTPRIVGGSSAVPGSCSRPLTADRRAHLDARLGEHGLPQQPLERRPPHDEHDQVLVARLRVAEVVAGRDGDAPGAAQGVEHVGEVAAHLDDEAGQEAVGLVHLLGAAAVGEERLLGVSGRGQRVAFEQDHPMPGPTEGERAAQATDPRTDHDDLFAHAHPPDSGNACCQMTTIRYG